MSHPTEQEIRQAEKILNDLKADYLRQHGWTTVKLDRLYMWQKDFDDGTTVAAFTDAALTIERHKRYHKD